MSPISPANKRCYPKNWNEIREQILARAGNKCEVCGVENHTFRNKKLIVLTIAHMDHTPENCLPENLKALCQKCHNSYDAEHRAETRRIKQQAKTATPSFF
jgi:5-methylcytosine-specific restriction endonuclease McrA